MHQTTSYFRVFLQEPLQAKALPLQGLFVKPAGQFSSLVEKVFEHTNTQQRLFPIPKRLFQLTNVIPFAGNLKSETSGDRTYAILHSVEMF